MIVISGYTLNTDYEQEVKDLESDLKRFNLPYKLYGYESRGDWTKNTMVKAELIQRALKEYPNEDVIWLDADAVIVKEPKLFHELKDKTFDICCHYLKTRYNPNELLSGTIIFRNNDVVNSLVDDWVNDSEEVNWDQKILQKYVDGKYEGKLKKLALPIEYIKIRPRSVKDTRKLDCVIGHKQMSREQRHKIK
jgi:hypothetical protein